MSIFHVFFLNIQYLKRMHFLVLTDAKNNKFVD